MAVTTQTSAEYDDQFTSGSLEPVYPTEVRGGMCYDTFTTTQSGAGDATSSFAIIKLPPGRVRVHLGSCGMYCNWTTASATLDLGWDAYTDASGSSVAADPDGLVDGVDVDTAGWQTGALLIASAGTGAAAATGHTKLFDSEQGVVLRITSQDVAIADTNTCNGVIAYTKA